MLVLSATLFSLARSCQQTQETLIIKWTPSFSGEKRETRQNKLQEVIYLGGAAKNLLFALEEGGRYCSKQASQTAFIEKYTACDLIYVLL